MRHTVLFLPIASQEQIYYLRAIASDQNETPMEQLAEEIFSEFGTAHLPMGTHHLRIASLFRWFRKSKTRRG